MNERVDSSIESTQESVQQSPETSQQPTLWQENHGNLLIVYVLIVFAIGAAVLFYRQNRFVPVSFPQADMIDTPGELDQPTAAESKSIVTIEVSGAANDDGAIKVAVYATEASYGQMNKAIVAETIPITNGVASLNVLYDRLPARFGIAAYHDENRDDKLSRNHLGIPTERYGFSNGARGLTGPPPFQEILIRRPAPGTRIVVFIL